MRLVICPQGSGEINIHMNKDEAQHLYNEMTRGLGGDLDWDHYTMSAFCSSLRTTLRDDSLTEDMDIDDIEYGADVEPDLIGHVRNSTTRVRVPIEERLTEWRMSDGAGTITTQSDPFVFDPPEDETEPN